MSSGKRNVVVSEVILDGNQRTKVEYFRRLLADQSINTVSRQDLTSNGTAATKAPLTRQLDLDGLKAKLGAVDQRLRESQLFEDVDIQLQPVDEVNGAIKV